MGTRKTVYGTTVCEDCAALDYGAELCPLHAAAGEMLEALERVHPPHSVSCPICFTIRKVKGE